MSLLPQNSKTVDQKFAVIIDTRSRVDYSDIDTDPFACDASLLPHIAFSKGANIDNMTESEARAYLKTFKRKALGTVGAVEDAINVCFDDAKLIEWFEDSNLEVGMFNIDVDLKSDTSLVYDGRLFSLSTRLINSAKNVRSKLNNINIKINSLSKFDYLFYTTADIKISNNLSFKQSTINFFLITQNITTIDIGNSSNILLKAEEKIKIDSGGVVDVKLKNNPNYQSEVGVDMKITGGVVWAF